MEREDGWETGAADWIELGQQSCSLGDASFVRTVVPQMRATAVARLEQVSMVELSQREAARLLGLPVPEERAGAVAALVIARQIAEMEQRRSNAYERRGPTDGWSRADEETLNQRKALLAERISTLKPVLVRAVAKARTYPPYYDGYWLRHCGDRLDIGYVSPLEPVSPARRQPVIVLLEQVPTAISVIRFEMGPFPSEKIAFGFDNVRWGTPTQTIRQTFPALTFAPEYQGAMNAKWGPPWIATQQFAYGGCNFQLAFRFVQNRLNSLTFTSVGASDACREQIERELNARYAVNNQGPIRSGPDNPFFSYAEWTHDPYFHVAYRFGDAMTIRFGASSLRALERADSINKCAGITLRYLPVARDPGVSSPLLQPLRPAFECDYPPISMRLQEQGAVQLSVQVRADGTVADAQVMQASHHPRLDRAAQKIAAERWTFTPAMKDGQPVDSEVRMEVNFALFPNIANDR